MNNFRVGAMVRIEDDPFRDFMNPDPNAVGHLGFITGVCTHTNHVRNGTRCIEITYLKPRKGVRGIDRNILVSYPYHDVSLATSAEART
jgi:hypothetical protein